MQVRLVVASALVIILAVLVTLNARSLYEGVFFYLRDVITYDPGAVKPLNREGRYATLYDLIRLRNAERLVYLQRHLQLPNVTVTPIPIRNSDFPDLLVRFGESTGPYTIFSAHYDKLFDNPDYQGASDNTAAISVLLAAVTELAARGKADQRAFLFTGEEETGLRGAAAFIDYVHANSIAVKEIVNFDNIGRGRIAIRPSAPVPGWVFALPFLGDIAYDGREFRPSATYPRANPRLTQALVRQQPDIVVYERFTAVSDSNVFEARGIDTVAISGDDMHYLELTWHTYGDRVELLDERNLDLAFELVIGYTGQ